MVTNNKHEAVDGWFYLTPGGGLPVWSDMQTFLHSDVCDLRAKKNAAGSARLQSSWTSLIWTNEHFAKGLISGNRPLACFPLLSH